MQVAITVVGMIFQEERFNLPRYSRSCEAPAAWYVWRLSKREQAGKPVAWEALRTREGGTDDGVSLLSAPCWGSET